MNIFYLNPDPKICAQEHISKHVTKMIIEYAQLLSTAHRILDGTLSTGLSEAGRKQTRYVLPDERESILYRSTHSNHPSAVWVRQSDANYNWLYQLLCELCEEYTYRYGKVHSTERLLETLSFTPNNIPHGPFTPPTPAMPDDVKIPNDSMASYHNYYINNKKSFASWQGRVNSRDVPKWFN